MACVRCGTAESKFYGGDYVGTKRTVTTFAAFDRRVAQTVSVTRTTYTDPIERRVELCSACLGPVLARAGTRQALIVMAIMGVLSLVMVVAMASPKATTGMRVFVLVFLVPIWLALIAFFVSERRRWRRGEYSRRDRPLLEDLARRHFVTLGRDTIFTPEQWRKALRESEREQAEDRGNLVAPEVDPLPPEARR